MRVAPLAVMVGVLGLIAGGCASTRTGELGLLPSRDPLVTLVVSQQHAVVARECPQRVTATPIMGCQTSRPVALPEGQTARVVKIVRYTDSLPSEMAFEIDLHELCHAVAALQPIRDPCHDGNGGQVVSGTGQKTPIVSR